MSVEFNFNKNSYLDYTKSSNNLAQCKTELSDLGGPSNILSSIFSTASSLVYNQPPSYNESRKAHLTSKIATLESKVILYQENLLKPESSFRCIKSLFDGMINSFEQLPNLSLKNDWSLVSVREPYPRIGVLNGKPQSLIDGLARPINLLDTLSQPITRGMLDKKIVIFFRGTMHPGALISKPANVPTVGLSFLKQGKTDSCQWLLSAPRQADVEFIDCQGKINEYVLEAIEQFIALDEECRVKEMAPLIIANIITEMPLELVNIINEYLPQPVL